MAAIQRVRQFTAVLRKVFSLGIRLSQNDSSIAKRWINRNGLQHASLKNTTICCARFAI
jgi:hypothetical protein